MTGASFLALTRVSSARAGKVILDDTSADKCSRMTAMMSWRKRKSNGNVGDELSTALLLYGCQNTTVSRLDSYTNIIYCQSC